MAAHSHSSFPSRPGKPVSADPDVRPGVLARFWWISVARGAVALVLGIAMILAGESRSAITSFIGAYWLLGALLTTRVALAIRWRRGSQLGLTAGAVGVVAALLVLLRERFSSIVEPAALVALLGISAILMGLLRVLGAFELQRRTGRRWTFGGLALGTVEIVLGLALLATDAPEARAVQIAAAAWALIGGALLLVEGLRLRRTQPGHAAERG
jgi:uncharacterized membrane protein HdeD (DUF308 family)